MTQAHYSTDKMPTEFGRTSEGLKCKTNMIAAGVAIVAVLLLSAYLLLTDTSSAGAYASGAAAIVGFTAAFFYLRRSVFHMKNHRKLLDMFSGFNSDDDEFQDLSPNK